MENIKVHRSRCRSSELSHNDFEINVNTYEYYKSLCNHQLLQVGLLLTTKLSLLFK